MKTLAMFKRRLTRLERIAEERKKQRGEGLSEIAQRIIEVFAKEEIDQMLAVSEDEALESIVEVLKRPQCRHIVARLQSLAKTDEGYAFFESMLDDGKAPITSTDTDTLRKCI
jgi:hypothetical protein